MQFAMLRCYCCCYCSCFCGCYFQIAKCSKSANAIEWQEVYLAHCINWIDIKVWFEIRHVIVGVIAKAQPLAACHWSLGSLTIADVRYIILCDTFCKISKKTNEGKSVSWCCLGLLMRMYANATTGFFLSQIYIHLVFLYTFFFSYATIFCLLRMLALDAAAAVTAAAADAANLRSKLNVILCFSLHYFCISVFLFIFLA